MTRWKKSEQTAKFGVNFVESVVNDHGSIFRPVHEETDVGIDGYIELVNAEDASGRLIAVQIKSGESYYSERNNEFIVRVNEKHLRYWENYMVPVILVCYSPERKLGVWESVRDYIENQRYQDRPPVTQIRISPSRVFSSEAIGTRIGGLAHARADERILLKCADKCLSPNVMTRREGFSILQAHPDSRKLKITARFARELLMDADEETAKNAMFALGYSVGRKRWSFNPNNREEEEVIGYAQELCKDLTNGEIQRLLELIDDEHFSGPQGLGERCFDILACCELSQRVLYEVACDKLLPMVRRANALYMYHGCDNDGTLENSAELIKDEKVGDVYHAMYGDVAQREEE